MSQDKQTDFYLFVFAMLFMLALLTATAISKHIEKVRITAIESNKCENCRKLSN